MEHSLPPGVLRGVKWAQDAEFPPCSPGPQTSIPPEFLAGLAGGIVVCSNWASCSQLTDGKAQKSWRKKMLEGLSRGGNKKRQGWPESEQLREKQQQEEVR